MAEFFTPGADPLTESRHRARYHFAATFIRSGMTVIDVPCGTGYGRSLFPEDIQYVGMDRSETALTYAQQHYTGTFRLGEMADLPVWPCDLICCIEGLEHLQPKDQKTFLTWCAASLQPSGTLVLTCPEAVGVSGPNHLNPYHLHELTRKDFTALVKKHFGSVEIVTMREALHTGLPQTCLYAVCREPK